jgi:hypothetical protein
VAPAALMTALASNTGIIVFFIGFCSVYLAIGWIIELL